MTVEMNQDDEAFLRGLVTEDDRPTSLLDLSVMPDAVVIQTLIAVMDALRPYRQGRQPKPEAYADMEAEEQVVVREAWHRNLLHIAFHLVREEARRPADEQGKRAGEGFVREIGNALGEAAEARKPVSYQPKIGDTVRAKRGHHGFTDRTGRVETVASEEGRHDVDPEEFCVLVRFDGEAVKWMRSRDLELIGRDSPELIASYQPEMGDTVRVRTGRLGGSHALFGQVIDVVSSPGRPLIGQYDPVVLVRLNDGREEWCSPLDLALVRKEPDRVEAEKADEAVGDAATLEPSDRDREIRRHAWKLAEEAANTVNVVRMSTRGRHLALESLRVALDTFVGHASQHPGWKQDVS